MKINIINKSNNSLPEYKTIGSAGLDLLASNSETILLKPMQRALIPTGLYIELPMGFEAQIRPRSGLALKNGITCLNTPGTIDSDYRGEIGVILINLSNADFAINNGDRIAQMIIANYTTVTLNKVDIIENTERGIGGFGSTGLN
ncbi:MAG: dUTP diphosphatase [Solirubrobacteraceae bacterium]